MENNIWIDEVIKPKIVEKILRFQISPKPTLCLHIVVNINGEEKIIGASKKDLIKLSKIINKHFENKKIGDY